MGRVAPIFLTHGVDGCIVWNAHISAQNARLSVRLSKWACPKITSGQSYSTTRSADVDRWFNRIRQVAAMCPPMMAH